MKQLNLVFFDQSGKTKNTFRIAYAAESLEKAAVEQAMNDLAALGLFINKEGQPLYVNPVSAKYVETTETPIIEAQ
jgi:hypothetical protein